MKAETVLRLVSGALQDFEPDVAQRWSWEFQEGRIGLLDFLNSAVRAIVLQRPELTAVTEAIRLEPGMRQKLPVSKRHGPAVMLIELIRNMGESGDCPGPAIIAVNPDILMAWACPDESGAVIENWAYDRLTNPGFYMVYPAVSPCAEVWVEATFSVRPCVICYPDDEIHLPDDYAPALEHHMLASIMSGDNDASNGQKALYHMQLFNSLLGVKASVDMTWPKAKSSRPGG